MSEGRKKTTEELLKELAQLRQKLSSLEQAETERRKCETDLTNFAKLPSEDPYPVLRIARNGTLLYANAASTPLLLDWGCRTGQPVPSEWHQLASEVLKAGLRENVEIEHKSRVFSFVVVPIKGGDYVNLYGRDITEQKEAEQKLRAAYEKLKETQVQLIQSEKLEAIGKLASGVAHEVKNPLGILMLGINYLEQRLKQAHERDVFDTIQKLKHNVRRADDIIQALLDFSRATELHTEPCSINTIVESSLQLVQPRIREANIELVKDLKDGLPDVVVDPRKIEQVFVNIFLNAIQAMQREGKLTVRSYLTQVHELKNGVKKRSVDHIHPGETVAAIDVEDQGTGIPEEHLKKIFDPFFTTKGPQQGTGLGLSVTKNIIELHKGIIQVKSVVDKGTNVTVMFKTVGGFS